ncbi:MAG: helix-turn-helix transcriptional regulator [Paenisporosarcina sp.]
MIGYGERLKSLRLASNLTMDTVSKAAGIAKSTYAGYEAEFRQPSLEKLVFFADYFQVSTDYILCLTSEQQNIGKCSSKDFLNHSKKFHWDGIPLSHDDMKEILCFLEEVIEKNEKSNHKLAESCKGLS